MPRFWETDEFKAAQRAWYAKAMVAGHVDVESYRDTDSTMFMTHAFGERAGDAQDVALAMGIADRAQEELDYPERFNDLRERAVWCLYAKGEFSYREIADVIGTSRRPVADAIERVKLRILGKTTGRKHRPWKRPGVEQLELRWPRD